MSPLRIPHAPLSDAEWQAILPHLRHDPTRGRPCDRRAQFDAIFRVAATDGPWHELPEPYGKHATIARYFRRLCHAGFWEHLLLALAASPAGHPLRRIEGLICRACRRAIRIRGLRIIVLARRLRLYRAMPAPPCLMPDPDLSEFVRRQPLSARVLLSHRPRRVALDYIRTLKKLVAAAGGRRRIPRIFRTIWP